MWRSDFGFARRQHSLANIGYTDDELLEWRKPFDEIAKDNRISFPDFERFVSRKYKGIIGEEQLSTKVRFFWNLFDRDNSDFVDFGEFISAGLLFDVHWAKEKIRKEGIEATFLKYAGDGFMMEPHFFHLMCDFRFFVTTATDVRKLIRIADQDRDGLVNISDFVQWAESADTPTLAGGPAKAAWRKGPGGARAVQPPPPEPE